jgi:hypothetical protein
MSGRLSRIASVKRNVDEVMTSRTRGLILLLAWAMACCATSASAQGEGKTLREELTERHAPMENATLVNLDKKITSGAELDDATQFLIAYYVDDGTSRLNPPIFLERLDRKTGKWQSAKLGDPSVKVQDMDVNCLGSVLSVTSFGGRFFLDTHLSPSAGCVLILSQELKLQASLYGWIVGHLGDDQLIYHRSQVHFAPVHSAEIALYDLQTKRDLTIFPRKPFQAIRQARIAQLQEFYRTREAWCRENDDPCDPEDFDSSLAGEIIGDQREQALAFIISYGQIQVFSGDQKPSGPAEVVYVYWHVKDEAKMQYREMLWSEVRERAGNVPFARLLEPAILEKLFGGESK